MTGFEHLLTGRTLGGRYRIDALIGRGGMGAVYRAADERLGRPVAVKVISAPAGVGAAARDELRVRFQREARAAARLHHPNVVTIHDFGTDAELGLDYLVMGLLDGEDLASRMARGEPFTVAQAAAVLRGAARGLAAGHRIGLVHRDVKPGNLFLCRGTDEAGGAEVRVLDFGIAKAMADEGTLTHLTRFGHAPVSPAYAAPEQLRAGGEPGPACDVYGLGAIGWELLAGSRPFSDEQVRRIADGVAVPLPTPPPGSPLDGPLGVLLLRSLSADPALRPADAGAFLDALDDALAGRALPPPARARTPLAARWRGRGKPAPGPPAPGAGDRERPAMAACPECGQMVSRQAPACPRCGKPLGRRRRRAATIAAFVVGSVLAGGGVFALGTRGLLRQPGSAAADSAIRALDTARVLAERKPVHVPRPRWVVGSVESDDSCSKLFDACMRVRCTVANTGDADGETEVTARLLGERDFSRTRGVRVEAGGREVLYFDFPEVHNGERFDRVTCRPAAGGRIAPGTGRAGRAGPRDTLVL